MTSLPRIAGVTALGLVALLPAGALAQISVSASPASMTLLGETTTTLNVRNAGTVPSVIDVSAGNYVIARDGRVRIDPKLPPARSAKRWLLLSPARLTLPPGGSGLVRVQTRIPRIAAPGDHHALILLTGSGAQPGAAQVRVRARVGVGVLVRVPGVFRRELTVTGMRVMRAGGERVIQLRLANRGNVNESLRRGQVRVAIRQGRKLATAQNRRAVSVLPGTGQIVSIPYRGGLRGPVKVTLTVRPTAASQAGPSITTTPPAILRRSVMRF